MGIPVTYDFLAGLMYEEGDGCELNFLKAAECYRNAAELESPHAHFNLGYLLLNGKGVAHNADAAQAHFRKVRCPRLLVRILVLARNPPAFLCAFLQAMDLGYALAQQFVHDASQ